MKYSAFLCLSVCLVCGWASAGPVPAVVRDLELVGIPAASFMMGSGLRSYSDVPEKARLTLFYEQPRHQVSLDAFRISACEITQAQYMAVMDSSNPSYFKDGDELPVDRVLWAEAVVFCNRLSRLAGLQPCYNLDSWECDFSRNGFRLPTEAEWMYTASAGAETNYYNGETENDLVLVGWYSVTSGQVTHPVGSKKPNAWGLYDMHGNLWEWCNDWFSETYYGISPVLNPTGPSVGTLRVVRGGGWLSDAYYCRLNSRAYSRPNIRRSDLGFRVVCRP